MESHRTDVSKEENIEYLPDLFEYTERKFLSATGEAKFRIYRLKSHTKDKKVRCSEITENYPFLFLFFIFFSFFNLYSSVKFDKRKTNQKM